MRTYDHRPPQRSRKLPRGYLSTTLTLLTPNVGEPLRYIAFLPRAVWPINPKNHEKALLNELFHLEKQSNYETAPESTESALETIPRVSSNAPRLIHYHPNTPYVLHVSRGDPLGPHDMLYYLERVFGHCLIDRTGTLNRRSPVRILRPMPPYDPDFNYPISKLCEKRAAEIIHRAAEECRQIAVLWSGGIDSTAVVVALLRVMDEEKWKSIHILYTNSSICENPRFHKWLKIRTKMTYLGYSISNLYNKPVLENERPSTESTMSDWYGYQQIQPDVNRVTIPFIVTGEIGDQIFGSVLAEYFYKDSRCGSFMRGKQDQAWKPFFSQFLIHYKIIPVQAIPSLIEYIEPQVAKSPIPIVNAFDLLWWLNFSLKWQHVCLRLPLLMEVVGAAEFMNRIERTINFFDTEYFQQWSYHNHHLKMANRSKWSTYKAPLKEYIYDFNRDKEYRDYKLKERSLKAARLDNNEAYEENIRASAIGVDEFYRPIQFGANSISLSCMIGKYGEGGCDLPKTDLNSTVLATGSVWEASKSTRSMYIDKMNSHGVKNTVKKVVSSKSFEKRPYEEQEDWKYWFITHRPQIGRDIEDYCDASELFGNAGNGE